MSKNKNKRAQVSNRSNKNSNSTDMFITQANNRLNHPFSSTIGMIVCNAIVCFLIGMAIAAALELLIDSKDEITWSIAISIAIGTATIQVISAFINSIIIVPISTKIARRVTQRRIGMIFGDEIVEKAIDENEQQSRIGPAAIAATASFFILLQYDAPDWALLYLPASSATISSIVAHLTDHKTIRTLWKGIKESYYKKTMGSPKQLKPKISKERKYKNPKYPQRKR